MRHHEASWDFMRFHTINLLFLNENKGKLVSIITFRNQWIFNFCFLFRARLGFLSTMHSKKLRSPHLFTHSWRAQVGRTKKRASRHARLESKRDPQKKVCCCCCCCCCCRSAPMTSRAAQTCQGVRPSMFYVDATKKNFFCRPGPPPKSRFSRGHFSALSMNFCILSSRTVRPSPYLAPNAKNHPKKI